MPRIRIPEGDDWRDHATVCPNCKQPVMRDDEHYVKASMTDPAWYDCDRVDDCPRCSGTGAIDTPFSGSDPSCPECDGTGTAA